MKDAPVTIVEFADFQCPACADAVPIIESILSDYHNQVLFVFRDLPLDTFILMHLRQQKQQTALAIRTSIGKCMLFYLLTRPIWI